VLQNAPARIPAPAGARRLTAAGTAPARHEAISVADRRLTSRILLFRSATVRVRFLLSVSLLFGAGCANHDPSARNDSIVAAGEADYAASHRTIMAPDPTEVAAKAAPAPLGDAGVAELASQGNLQEIDFARVAVNKATSGAVKLWARQMIDDHGRNDRDLRDLVKRLKLSDKPLPALTSTAEHDRLKARLVALPRGLAFDTAFVHQELDAHASDLTETKTLAAKAKDAELKKLITESLDDLQRHHDRASALSRLLIPKK
jgi:putative membrane protein